MKNVIILSIAQLEYALISTDKTIVFPLRTVDAVLLNKSDTEVGSQWVPILEFFTILSLYVLSLKSALEIFPELTVITRDSKTKSGGASVSKIKMNGKAYNKKTLRASKSTTKLAQVSVQRVCCCHHLTWNAITVSLCKTLFCLLGFFT